MLSQARLRYDDALASHLSSSPPETRRCVKADLQNQKPIGFLESALNENIITVLGIEIINGYLGTQNLFDISVTLAYLRILVESNIFNPNYEWCCTGMVQNMGARLRDSVSRLPLPAGPRSRNLGPTFCTITVYLRLGSS